MSHILWQHSEALCSCIICSDAVAKGEEVRKPVELLETWLILEYCDHGSLEGSSRSGSYKSDLVSAICLCSLVPA